MNKNIPIYKGFIISILMVVVTLTLYFTKQPGNSLLQIIVYALYIGGILWTIVPYSRSATFNGKFAELFAYGFRYFIIVTLIMVLFTAVFSLIHPEFSEEAATYIKEQLIKEGNKTPIEIEKEVIKVKKEYTTSMISIAVFRYLIIGALFTAGGAGILTSIRRKS